LDGAYFEEKEGGENRHDDRGTGICAGFITFFSCIEAVALTSGGQKMGRMYVIE
jgi:hypothetical protein